MKWEMYKKRKKPKLADDAMRESHMIGLTEKMVFPHAFKMSVEDASLIFFVWETHPTSSRPYPPTAACPEFEENTLKIQGLINAKAI